MPSLALEKLHIKYIGDSNAEGPAYPRRYTLTHSDRTGDLFLSIGTEYDQRALSNCYTRFMRDEVLAEFRFDEDQPELHVFCHVSGGFVFGAAGWRYRIFKYHLPGVMVAFYHGDAAFIKVNPGFDLASIQVHFQSSKARYHKIENWGIFRDYRIDEVNHET